MATNHVQLNTPMTDEALPLKCTVSSYSILKTYVVSLVYVRCASIVKLIQYFYTKVVLYAYYKFEEITSVFI